MKRYRKWLAALAILLIGVMVGTGICFAISTHHGELQLWHQEVEVIDPDHLSVDGWSLQYSDHHTMVDKVRVKIDNSDVASHKATINVSVVGSVEGKAGVVDVTCGSGTTWVTLDIDPNVPIDGVTGIYIVLEETS